MITIYRSTEHGLITLDAPARGCWINVTNPSADEILRLQSEFRIPPDFLTHSLDVDELARTEQEDGETLIVLRVPYFEGEHADVPYTALPFGIVLLDDYLVTICRRETELARELASGRVRGLSTAKHNRFVLQALLIMGEKYLAYLRSINKAIDVLEDELQRSLRNREVMGLLKYQKSLVYFETALRSDELTLEQLQRHAMFQTYPEDAGLLEDVLIEIRQAIEMMSITNGILSSMMDAFASIISNNLNVVLKALTSLTIILAFPTMIASFYGMNVGMPFQNEPGAFALVIALSLVVAAGVAWVFWRKDWL